MAVEFPLHRFTEFGRFTPTELDAVKSLSSAPRRYERLATIRAEGEAATGFYVLVSGWAMASITLADGSRQILKVHLPGDALGTPSMSVERTAEALTTITPALVATVPFDRFGRLLQDHPRVAAFFLLSVQRERIALMDRLASIGRTSSEARVAAFLLDTHERLEPLGIGRGEPFDLPLTQEQIGDTVGLTAVHVNRTIRELETAQLVERAAGRWQLLDPAGLARVARRPVRRLRTDLGWLPAPT